jgi:hypothetical protein
MAESLEAIVARVPIETLLSAPTAAQRINLELAATRDAMTGALMARLSASDLSPTGLLLARLSAKEESPATSSATPLTGENPSSEDIRTALQKNISQSGMFYESHLARWSAGTLPLEDILEEPQARLGAAQDSAPTDTPRHELPINEEMAPILKRQISLLENSTLLWRGDVWPGQPAEIELRPEDQPPSEGDGKPDSVTPWTTRLAIHLPALGEVQATIRLRGQTVALSLSGASDLSINTLESARSDLEAALAVQNIDMERFMVVSHGDIPG